MNFDWICVGLAALFALVGLWRGLLRQIFGVIGFIGGLLLARLLAGPLAESFHGKVGLPINVVVVIAGVLIFFLTELVAKIVGNLLTGALGSFTGGINRFGGLLVGLAKGLLIVWAVASLAALAQPHLKPMEKPGGWLAKLDLEHSKAIEWSRNTSVLGDKAKDLRARAEREMKARAEKREAERRAAEKAAAAEKAKKAAPRK